MAWKWFWNTETKYYDGEINRDTDWGGDASTDNQPVSGGRVQEWLKTNINGRYGFLNMRFNDSESMYYIECFTSEDDYKQYESDKEAYKDLLLQSVQIPISTVEGDSFSVSMKTSLKNDANIVITDDNFEVPLNYRSIKISQIGNENANYAGTLIVESSTDGSTWNQMGTIPNVLISKDLTDTDTYQNVAIGQFLTQGRQQVRLRATYNYTNDEGVVKTVTSGNVMVGASVTKTSLRLELTTEYYQPMNAKDVNGNTQDFNVTYRVFGSVQKTLYLKIDGGSELKYDFDASVDSVNKTVSASGASYLTHGVHKVEAWLECQDGLGKTITSEKLSNSFMMVVDENDATPYLLLQNLKGWIDNFVQTAICEYAIYAPNQEKVDVAFMLTNYGNNIEYFRLETTVVPQTPNTLLTTVEIESENDASSLSTYDTRFRVSRKDGSTWTDFANEPTSTKPYLVIVDNTNAMTPVSGATFLMNPKARNNNEANPLRILNAKNNNAEVESVWTNADLINGTWMTDDEGNKVLRIMAGTTLEIKKNVWSQFRTNPNSSLTFEIDCKISNVTNTTDPIIQMFNGTASSFRGLKMNALEGWLRNGTEQSADDTLFAWQEDVRTHFSFNINHQVYPNAKKDCKYDPKDAAKADGSIALARVLVNGDCVRELKFDTTKVDEWSSSDEGSIIIGNEGADIDIYSIRMYEGKQLDTIEILTRNFLATLPKADDKVALKEKNDLLDGGLISLEKSKNAKLNCMIWHGILPYKNNSSEQNGWVEVWRYDNDGNYLADLSGTICKQTKSLEGKGQGSTAKTYYDWNLQEDSSKVTATIQVAVRDFHESISVRIDGDKAYIKGGNLGKNFPLDETEVAYPYANGMVTVPDGWIDGNGKYRGMGYMVAYGTALAQKRVIKINYASSMQSHLLGACKTYDLLHRKVVGDTPLQKQIPSAVAAKHTEPFMFFNQEEGGQTYFKGMGTYGAAKADKVAWGFVKKEMPMYALIEGSDNNLPMTGFRVPFDKNTAVYDCDGEGWLYNGVQNFDFDLGNTEKYSDATQRGEGWQFVNTDANNGEVPSKAVRDKWADIHNFIYLHSTNLKYFDGTFEQFKLSDSANDTNYKYWCTQGDQAYYLKRYDFINSKWIDAGLLVNNIYKAINLQTYEATSSAYNSWLNSNTGDYSELNNNLIEGFVSQMRTYIRFFINTNSLKFNYCYVLSFLAGTDNSDKNTYYKIMPYHAGGTSNTTFRSWFNKWFGKDYDFGSIHQLYFDGDDMDSILRTDNNSHLTKPYYIDRLHPYADEKPNDSLYEGLGNQLFNYVEKAYEGTHELASVMNQIMIAATELIDENDTKDNKLVGGKSLWGFLNKYFFNTQRYFPQIAYLEQARIRYEFPELLGYISSGGGARSIRPITQSLGSQLQAELQYMNQRVIYMTSYAGFGAWGGDSTHSIGLADANETFGFMPANMPDGSGSTYTFTIQPHQYIYPSYYLGQTFTQTHKRTSPKQTCTFTIAENLKDGGDTGIGICGINYISDLGDFKDKSVTTPVVVNGKRLTRFYLGYASAGIYRAVSTSILAKNVKNVTIYINRWYDSIDVSHLVRLEVGIFYQIRKVLIPESSNLKTLSFNQAQSLELINLPALSKLTIEGANNVREFSIRSNVGTNVEGFTVQPIVESIWNTQKSSASPKLQSIHVENVKWTDFDVEALSWLADIPTCELKGTISIKETDEYRPAVTWDLKNKFLRKFGRVDDVYYDKTQPLKLIYNRKEIDPSQTKIKGNFYVENGSQFQFEVVPSSIYANNQYSLPYFTCSGIGGVSMTSNGLLTVTSLSNTESFATIRVAIYYLYDKDMTSTHYVSKQIEIWNRPAQVGDLVFADGTFLPAEQYEGEKTVVGRCVYTAPRKADGSINEKFHNPADKMTRLMVSCDDIVLSDGTTEYLKLQWGAANDSGYPSSSIFETLTDGSKKGLSIDGGKTTIYDVPNLRNINPYSGLKTSSGSITSYITEESIRDYSDEGLENDGFKAIEANYGAGDGFAYNESVTFLNERKLDDTLLPLAGQGYTKGDIVNSGYAKTLRVIAHRNNILRTGLSQVGLEPESLHFHIPSGNDELYELAKCISDIRAWAKSENGLNDTSGNRWSQVYFPAISACYAFEPNNLMEGEILNPKFSKHNWFLPPEGLLVRIIYYTYDYPSGTAMNREDSPLNPIKNQKGETVFNRVANTDFWSVTEYASNETWCGIFSTGQVMTLRKFGSYAVRAICAF